MIILEIFLSFFLIGLSAYGGGMVTIPLIIHEIVEVKAWINFSEMSSLLAIAQMTPGPIAINAATFVGYETGGFVGGIIATLGVILPAIIILFIISPFMDRISGNNHVKRVRKGFQVGVVSLIIYATYTFGRGSLLKITDIIIAGGAFLALFLSKGKFHPILVIISGGILGILFL